MGGCWPLGRPDMRAKSGPRWRRLMDERPRLLTSCQSGGGGGGELERRGKEKRRVKCLRRPSLSCNWCACELCECACDGTLLQSASRRASQPLCIRLTSQLGSLDEWSSRSFSLGGRASRLKLFATRPAGGEPAGRPSGQCEGGGLVEWLPFCPAASRVEPRGAWASGGRARREHLTATGRRCSCRSNAEDQRAGKARRAERSGVEWSGLRWTTSLVYCLHSWANYFLAWPEGEGAWRGLAQQLDYHQSSSSILLAGGETAAAQMGSWRKGSPPSLLSKFVF